MLVATMETLTLHGLKRTDRKPSAGVIYNSNAPPTSSKFMVATGDGGGTPTGLTTPPFSLIGVNNPGI
jgi:hypothetical protein